MKVTGALVISGNYPGPGQYKIGKKYNGLRYSMRAKTLNPCKISQPTSHFKILIPQPEKFLARVNTDRSKESIKTGNNIGLNIRVLDAEKSLHPK